MRKIIQVFFICLLGATTLSAMARDTRLRLSIVQATEYGYQSGKLDKTMGLYFAETKPKKEYKTMGTYSSNKKTNAFNKTDMEACQWAFLSAMITFQNRAKQLGGDAIVNIVSNYKGRTFKSAKEFECGAGSVIAGVTFKGDVVKYKE